ncbi:acyltransferase family protein, partial [Enterobacter hormaechei]|nr:acyltransferase family protein [Enterobacter hormaechei]
MEIDNSPPRKNNLQYIQALRAIAAMLVVLCHARDFLKGTEYEWLAQRLFWPGAFGVDLFFIISGFIIIYTSHSYQSNDLIKFIKKRFLRVWPLYFIMTIAYIVIVKNVDLS